jgi:dUTP pyrophosphatase
MEMELQLLNHAGNYYNSKKNLKGDAGFDLYMQKTEEILPGETKLIDLQVSCQMRSFSYNPLEWYKNKSVYKYHGYLLLPRSSISKTPLIMKNSVGVIDATYTGNLKVPLLNTSDETFTVNAGERYFQIIHPSMKPFNTKLVQNLRDTNRGKGGFGSTGK